ncbi:hypothetical protein VPHK567_0180 [Vibrio phage K567]|nr:hypothetical protein MYOV011v1_p0033 [Vibrio phage 6E35.1a]
MSDKDFFGRVIKDGDFLYRAKNAGRSYTTEIILVVDCPDGKRRYVAVTGYGSNAKLPTPSRAMIVDPKLVEVNYNPNYLNAIEKAITMKIQKIS